MLNCKVDLTPRNVWMAYYGLHNISVSPAIILLAFTYLISLQQAMENFVFFNENKTKLIKMNKLKNIFTSPKIMGKCSKLHFF